ncbi:MAG: discoidin domain-containing protein [Akkermansia sp.]
MDVSIRPGWFWHDHENSRVRTPENLLELYFNSVGRGANLNLNVPPDRSGRIHEEDKKSLAGFRALLNELYSRNFAEGAEASASSTLNGYGARHVLDRKRTTYWIASKEDGNPSLTLKLPDSATFDVIRLAEPIQLGQRVRKFRVEVCENGRFVPWAEGSSIGARVMLKGRPVTTDEVRVVLEGFKAVPALCEVSLWKYPGFLNAPSVSYDRDGRVTLTATAGAVIRYTMDGTEPGPQSPVYEKPFVLSGGGTVKAVSEGNGRKSSVTARVVPVPSRDWKVIGGERAASAPELAFDGDSGTLWHTHAPQGEIAPPQALDIDMGRAVNVAAVLYAPRADSAKGTIDQYAVYFSEDGREWGAPAAEGEFSNIRANPVLQRIDLKTPVKARYLRFVGRRVLEGSHVVIAELGVLEK